MDLRTKGLLIEKYWNGTSSMEEEQLLKKTALTHPDLFTAEELNLFTSLTTVNTLKLPARFTADFLDQLEYEEAKKQYAVSASESEGQVKKMIWYKPLMRIAAAVVMLIGLGFGYQQFFTNKMTVAGLDESERAAFEESQKALVLMAQKMEKVQILTAALEKFDETQTKIRKNKSTNN